jgi:hypothetical protein
MLDSVQIMITAGCAELLNKVHDKWKKENYGKNSIGYN